MEISIGNKIYRVIRGFLNFGVINGFKYAFALLLRKNIQLKVRGIKKSVLVRGGDSDVVVVHDVLVKREYASPPAENVELILDLGANVGYSAVYFANMYPYTRIVAVEPQADNFQCLLDNCKPYPNIIAENKGVWWREAKVVPVKDSMDSWGYRFKEAEDGEGVYCSTIDQLMDKYALEGGVMVKMDIEGAEREIFENNPDGWLSRTRYLQLEIHDCWKSIFDEMSNYDYSAEINGENVVIELLGN